MFVHKTVNEEAENFYKNLRRRVYTTPKSYIELLESYKYLLMKKKEEIYTIKNKLETGLYKLNEAN